MNKTTKRKLNLKQKIALYKIRNLTWKDRKDIDKPLSDEEIKELEGLEMEVLEEEFNEFERCCNCKELFPQEIMIYATFMKYQNENDQNPMPLQNHYDFKQEASWNFEFCSYKCKAEYKRKLNERSTYIYR